MKESALRLRLLACSVVLLLAAAEVCLLHAPIDCSAHTNSQPTVKTITSTGLINPNGIQYHRCECITGTVS